MSDTVFGRIPGSSHRHSITIDDGIISAIAPVAEHAEPNDLTWVPGFVDLHNHGGNAGAFPTGTYDDCLRAATYHRSRGTTTLLASLVSGTQDELCSQSTILAALADKKLIHGIHMEGPFVAACRCGAQDPSRIVPGDPDFFAAVIEAAQGHLRSITFAPETAHAAELLELCAQHDIIASLGHTDADFDTTMSVIKKGRELGVTVTATHLFNAMPQIHHRNPGAAAALIAASRTGEVHCELVADGVHLADGTVDMVRGPGSFAITDAMEAAGMPDGDYRLGQLNVVVTDGIARITDADGVPGAIAGGTSTLAQQFKRYAARHGIEEAVAFTSTTAARVIGLSSTVGQLTPGFTANLVGLDTNLEPARVLVGGAEVPA